MVVMIPNCSEHTNRDTSSGAAPVASYESRMSGRLQLNRLGWFRTEDSYQMGFRNLIISLLSSSAVPFLSSLSLGGPSSCPPCLRLGTPTIPRIVGCISLCFCLRPGPCHMRSRAFRADAFLFVIGLMHFRNSQKFQGEIEVFDSLGTGASRPT